MRLVCYFTVRMPYLKQIFLDYPSNGTPMRSIMTTAMAVTVYEPGSI